MPRTLSSRVPGGSNDRQMAGALPLSPEYLTFRGTNFRILGDGTPKNNELQNSNTPFRFERFCI